MTTPALSGRTPSRHFLAALVLCGSVMTLAPCAIAQTAADDKSEQLEDAKTGVRIIGSPPPFASADSDVGTEPVAETSGSSEPDVADATDEPASYQEVDYKPVEYKPVGKDEPAHDEQPFAKVRLLQDLQAQTAKGSTQALRAQRALLSNLNETLLTLDESVWRDPRNVRAVALLLLSGGHPSIGEHLLKLDLPDSVDKQLISAALAYIEGRKSDAIKGLTQLDPLEMEPSLGGQIALVQAVLLLPHDLKNALASVDKARLLMPGSLIEEAALRRGVSIAAALDDPDLFQTYTMQYIRHYRNSIYNSDFRRRFGLSMRRFGASEADGTFDDLDMVISQFDLDSQRQFYLLLAHSGLVEGNLDLALKASTAALPLSMENTTDRSRAELYIAGSMVKADSLDKALQHLWAVQRNLLEPRDLLLADRVTDILNGIRHWPEATEHLPEFAEKRVEATPKEDEWELDVLTKARQQLDEADDLLSYADKPMKQASR
ncbi:chemotaxis protein [uncultured Cohaesibacter sp.]|uniref:chemotaxis protein n=1 Tax=uncultured Cohaesibacter sp. TaxID=1002546 RepID=UPI0029C7BDFE|nr:chemotaxis protein [uncultured Cohaesibacter sp.]